MMAGEEMNEAGAPNPNPEAEENLVGIEAEEDAAAVQADDQEVKKPSVPAPEPLVLDRPGLKWYVVHTYSGFENQAKRSLEERIKLEGLEEFFGHVLVPTEEVTEVIGGSKRKSKRKFFPGYMLVQMAINDRTWYLVKETPKVTGFVGNARNPMACRLAEVERLTKQMHEGTGATKIRIEFSEGEQVRVTDGPFANFNGVISEVREDKQKVRVLVSILGRPTPVELDFMQVEKIAE